MAEMKFALGAAAAITGAGALIYLLLRPRKRQLDPGKERLSSSAFCSETFSEESPSIIKDRIIEKEIQSKSTGNNVDFQNINGHIVIHNTSLSSESNTKENDNDTSVHDVGTDEDTLPEVESLPEKVDDGSLVDDDASYSCVCRDNVSYNLSTDYVEIASSLTEDPYNKDCKCDDISHKFSSQENSSTIAAADCKSFITDEETADSIDHNDIEGNSMLTSARCEVAYQSSQERELVACHISSAEISKHCDNSHDDLIDSLLSPLNAKESEGKLVCSSLCESGPSTCSIVENEVIPTLVNDNIYSNQSMKDTIKLDTQKLESTSCLHVETEDGIKKAEDGNTLTNSIKELKESVDLKTSGIDTSSVEVIAEALFDKLDESIDNGSNVEVPLSELSLECQNIGVPSDNKVVDSKNDFGAAAISSLSSNLKTLPETLQVKSIESKEVEVQYRDKNVVVMDPSVVEVCLIPTESSTDVQDLLCKTDIQFMVDSSSSKDVKHIQSVLIHKEDLVYSSNSNINCSESIDSFDNSFSEDILPRDNRDEVINSFQAEKDRMDALEETTVDACKDSVCKESEVQDSNVFANSSKAEIGVNYVSLSEEESVLNINQSRDSVTSNIEGENLEPTNLNLSSSDGSQKKKSYKNRIRNSRPVSPGDETTPQQSVSTEDEPLAVVNQTENVLCSSIEDTHDGSVSSFVIEETDAPISPKLVVESLTSVPDTQETVDNQPLVEFTKDSACNKSSDHSKNEPSSVVNECIDPNSETKETSISSESIHCLSYKERIRNHRGYSASEKSQSLEELDETYDKNTRNLKSKETCPSSVSEIEPETLFNPSPFPVQYIFYEFEIPQALVGRLIGRKGAFVNRIKAQTDATIVVKPHRNRKYKICAVEGTKDQVDSALELIRKNFPLSRYPDLTLDQVYNCSPTPMPPVEAAINPQAMQIELAAGVVVEVRVSAVVSGKELWVQQPLHPSFSSIQKLHSCMNVNYGDGSTSPSLAPHVREGIVCVAQIDSQWYRVQVLSVIDDIAIIVLLDVGGTITVPVSELRQIRRDYILLPFQASQCLLHGIQPISEKGWDESSAVVLQELVSGAILSATVVSYTEDGVPLVNLYRRNQDEYVYLNERLVNLGHAKWISTPSST
ncbi:hypothetical protein SK128_025061 [Halocaridina rubra]|uniref:Tudor domain-containing protein n=1 Tax=Halocaridina rubra TaxID=373956 RepID=A0AAN8XT30_HALRR